MAIIKAPPKQPKTVTIQARVEESVKAQLDRYAEFIDSSTSYVITEALKLLFKRDDEFKRHPHKERITNMKSRPTQFGVRENTASSRQHASRLGVDVHSNPTCVDVGSPEARLTAPPIDSSKAVRNATSNAAPQHGATGEERDGSESSVLTSPVRPLQKSRLAFEPLIDSPEAAKLLGNIHVKTLQRYARTRRLPGYQIGGHWYFRASELAAWLHSRINSSCHPCRLNQEESDGT